MIEEPECCPKCSSESLHYLGAYNVLCEDCDHRFNLRVLYGLSPTHCEACGMRLSWGCGHETEHEREAVRHRLTTEHVLGDCQCFVARPGYAPRFTREEWRDRVAALTRDVIEGTGDLHSNEMRATLFR